MEAVTGIWSRVNVDILLNRASNLPPIARNDVSLR